MVDTASASGTGVATRIARIKAPRHRAAAIRIGKPGR
jgi:hypothetical protein